MPITQQLGNCVLAYEAIGFALIFAFSWASDLLGNLRRRGGRVRVTRSTCAACGQLSEDGLCDTCYYGQFAR